MSAVSLLALLCSLLLLIGSAGGETSLSFVPAIADECTSVSDHHAVLVYWMCEDSRCSTCGGDPEFIAVGRPDSGSCFQDGFKELDLLSVTYLGCTVDRSKGCVWTADYNGLVSRNLFPTFACTTGSNQASGESLPPGQPLPSIARNQFAVNSQTGVASSAPFELETCWAPMNPTHKKRSYKIYCSYESVPLEWRNKLSNVTELNPFATTTAAATSSGVTTTRPQGVLDVTDPPGPPPERQHWVPAVVGMAVFGFLMLCALVISLVIRRYRRRHRQQVQQHDGNNQPENNAFSSDEEIFFDENDNDLL